MATINNTVYLKVVFSTKAGVVSDPTSITLKIYDDKRHLLDQYTIGVSDKLSTGTYEKAYEVPSGTGDLIYEYAGILEGKPIVFRDTFPRNFVGN